MCVGKILEFWEYDEDFPRRNISSENLGYFNVNPKNYPSLYQNCSHRDSPVEFLQYKHFSSYFSFIPIAIRQNRTITMSGHLHGFHSSSSTYCSVYPMHSQFNPLHAHFPRAAILKSISNTLSST